MRRYDRLVPRAAALVDEIATELNSWPGVQVDRHTGGPLLVSYDGHELGVLDRDRGVAELRFAYPEREALLEHGDAEPAEPLLDAENVSHDVRGPADVSAVLELFDRRYRDLRGEDDPFSSRDPG
jgi:Family of unknown function (DUF5519)